MKRFDRTRFSKAGKRPAGRHGLVLLFYGNGKGKTTAAVGVAARAAGAGLKVCFVQFMKTEKWQSHERQALKKLGMRVRVLGTGFVGILDDERPVTWHRRQAKAALSGVVTMLRRGRYDVVVADEIVSAVDERLLTVADVLRLIRSRPPKTHLLLTGHSRYPRIIAASDLVTEMRNVKHPYYTKGMLAQRGIDF